LWVKAASDKPKLKLMHSPQMQCAAMQVSAVVEPVEQQPTPTTWLLDLAAVVQRFVMDLEQKIWQLQVQAVAVVLSPVEEQAADLKV
jgi:hypothetical protein